MQSSLVFAARYAHSRATGASLVVVRAAIQHWSQLDDLTKHTLIKESFEAEHNPDDWQMLRDHEANIQ